jgi:protein gp37
MEREWVEAIFRQCRCANVPFFFKQWGGIQKHRTGRKLFGRVYDEMPWRRVQALAELDVFEKATADPLPICGT